MIFTVLAAILILVGLLFFLGCVVGLVRFPDFYTRMHAAGKGDTLSSLLILVGLGLLMFRSPSEGFPFAEVLVFLKIAGIGAFIMTTSPTSTHALMQAGFEEGVEPVTKKKKGKNAK